MTSKRDISATNETGWLAENTTPIMFVRLAFASGVKRYHTEVGDLTATTEYGAEVYEGIGDFGGLSSDIVESVSTAAQAVQITLSATKSALVNTALTDDYFRRDIDMYIALRNAAGALIDDPESLFSGYMDKVDIALDDKTAIMTMNCESRGTNFNQSSDQRFTDEDKQAETTGDLIAEYVYRMQDLSFIWGGNVPFFSPGGNAPNAPGSPLSPR